VTASTPSTTPSGPAAPDVPAAEALPAGAPSTRSGTAGVVRRAATAIPVAVGAGVVLGGLAWLSDDLGYPLGLLVPANLVGAWALLAFVAGAGARSVVGGAARGLIALLAAVATYYLAYSILGEGWRAAGAFRAATIWGAVAVLAGPALGLAGGAWRHGTGWVRPAGIAVPSGILIAEGLLFQVQVPNDVAARSMLTVEVVVGLALPLVAVRGWRARAVAIGLAVLVATSAILGLLVLLPALRSAADTF
jgi:hypothetical protein